jgi:hypothetical protein
MAVTQTVAPFAIPSTTELTVPTKDLACRQGMLAQVVDQLWLLGDRDPTLLFLGQAEVLGAALQHPGEALLHRVADLEAGQTSAIARARSIRRFNGGGEAPTESVGKSAGQCSLVPSQCPTRRTASVSA